MLSQEGLQGFMDSTEKDDSLRPLGRHLVRLEGDIIWIRQSGALSLDEMVSLFELFENLYERYGYAMCLGDATHAENPSAEVRRYLAERLKQRIYPSHSALFGASAVVRTLTTLTQRAIELVTRKSAPYSFHKDEAAARERLERERPLLQAKGPPRG